MLLRIIAAVAFFAVFGLKHQTRTQMLFSLQQMSVSVITEYP
jgi:hypothetical protein